MNENVIGLLQGRMECLDGTRFIEKTGLICAPQRNSKSKGMGLCRVPESSGPS